MFLEDLPSSWLLGLYAVGGCAYAEVFFFLLVKVLAFQVVPFGGESDF